MPGHCVLHSAIYVEHSVQAYMWNSVQAYMRNTVSRHICGTQCPGIYVEHSVQAYMWNRHIEANPLWCGSTSIMQVDTDAYEYIVNTFA